jgi:predicted nucleic-acid-binding protein
MIAVDTNVLVRILVDDPDQSGQVQAARNIASEAVQVFVPQIVQVEMVWVLQSAYGMNKADIARALDHLLHNRAFELQAEDHFLEALGQFKNTNIDFADCLILAESQAVKSPLVTFDKKLARLSGVKLVE